jgi:hypothetical protein
VPGQHHWHYLLSPCLLYLLSHPDYWLIFITRLLYREKHTPGKFLDLNKYISKNIVFTYIPSIAVTLVVLIAANIDQTSSEANCWRLIQ